MPMLYQCKNCGRMKSHAMQSKCSACNEYYRRHKVERPYRDEDGRAIHAIRGEAHYAWKGNDAGTDTKRNRARRLYALGLCEQCGERAIDRKSTRLNSSHSQNS